MTFKEWNAVIMIAGQVVALAKLWSGGTPDTLAATATRLLWICGFMIAWNIIAAIVIAIAVAIVTQKQDIDPPADERDRWVTMRSARNAYFGVAVGGTAALILAACGYDGNVALYAIFGALMLGGFIDAASQLVYYRIG